MEQNDLEHLVMSLATLATAQTGRIAALETMCHALATTMVTAFPPLAADLTQHLEGLADFSRNTLDEDALPHFDNMLEELHDGMRRMQGR